MKVESFKFENGTIMRVLPELLNETSWFIAKDCCDILEISDTSQAMERLDGDEKELRKLNLTGQERDIWTVNEFGLYSLILASNKPEAKTFKRWITHEVLPAIRKAGRYSTDEMNSREASIQKLISEIDVLEYECRQIKASLSDKNKMLKAKQTELKMLLKADVRQLKLDF
jgi:prophage antirepressor-like protein